MITINEVTLKIHITRGDYATMYMELTDADGSEHSLASGEKLVMAIGTEPNTPLVEITAVNNLFTFLPEHTKKLKAAPYHYDIEIRNSTNEPFTVVEWKEFELGKEVSK